MFQTKVVEKNQTTHFVCFFLNCAICEIMWKKNCRMEQVTDGNMAHVRCMLNN